MPNVVARVNAETAADRRRVAAGIELRKKWFTDLNSPDGILKLIVNVIVMSIRLL